MEKEKMIKLSIILTLLIYTFGYLGFSYYKYSQPYVEYIRFDADPTNMFEDGRYDVNVKFNFGENPDDKYKHVNREYALEYGNYTITQMETSFVSDNTKGLYPIPQESFKNRGYYFIEYLWENSNLNKFLNTLSKL